MSISTVSAPHASRSGTRQAVTLWVVNATNLMFVVATNSVNVALPDIRRAFGLTATGLSWVVTGYALAFAGLILVSGKLGAAHGARTMLAVGTAVFVVASVVTGLAPNATVLVAARVVQGAGAAVAAPSTLVLLMAATEPGHRRSRALGFFVLARGAGGAVGLILGGVLAATAGWQWVAFVNVPFGLAVIAGALLFVDETERRRAPLDWAGAVLSTLLMAALISGFTSAAASGWASLPAVVAFVVSVLTAVALTLVESRHQNAVVPPHLFATMRTAVPYFGMLLVSGGMYAFFYFLAIFAQDVLGYDPIGTGLALTPFVLALVVVSQLTPRLMPRLGERWAGSIGLSLMVVGMGWLALLHGTSTYGAGILGPALLLGAGVGLSLAPLTALVMHHAPATHVNEASSLLQAMQQLGGAVGVAVLTSLYVTGTADGGTAHGVALAMGGGAVLVVAALVLLAGWGVRVTDSRRRAA